MSLLPRIAAIGALTLGSHGLAQAEAAKKLSPEPTAGRKSIATFAERIRPSIVKIIQVGREGIDGLGAGFVVREDGLIATNRHVIGEARRIQVETSDGRKHEVTEVLANDVHLDLALVRIAKAGLKPLPLGDSRNARQGDPIVTMGVPEGLDFSVVEGVISALRDVEEIPMIQVAVPIERGNSGGPLLSEAGEVLGIVTLKSLRTDNLGFAMPVNELKRLLNKPNPVPMSRWLTIGVLDPKTWSPALGGQWTQHAGVLKAEIMGNGFGGRTLCLWQPEEPQRNFEAAVAVKLEDEQGAAGLAFCSDGGHRHYGFYPTAGRLRLTRFEGPDVFSWTVLADLDTDGYRPGEWNHLRVRVDEQSIRCFVNGRQVLVQQDSALRGGRVGLCKFRSPAAEFKGFRIGADLAEKPLAPEVAEDLRKALGDYLNQSSAKDKALERLLTDADTGRRIITEKRKALEQDAATLRELESDLHQRSIAGELSKQLARPEGQIELLRCALLISKHDNPDVDVEFYLRIIRRMADELKADPIIRRGTAEAIKQINRYLFAENGFHGSRHDYYNNSNSYINEVLDDREGIPITLAVIYLELASKLGVPNLFGAPLPGRFMVGFRDGDEPELRLVDVFDGGKLLDEVEAAEVALGGESLPADSLKPATRKEIVLRMIRNLLGNALDGENASATAMPYLNLILALEPDSGAERFSRARIREMKGDLAGAREDVGWLIKHPPQGLPDEDLDKLDRWFQSLSQ